MTMPILQNRDYTLSVMGTMGRNSVVALLGNYMVIGRLKNNTITFRITDFTVEDTIVLICPEGGSITHAQLERGNKASDWTPAPEDLKAEIDSIVSAVDVINNTTLPALEDGLLNKSEKEAVKQSLNVVTAEKSGLDNQYDTLCENTYITDTQQRTDLINNKSLYDTAHQNLVSAINTVLNVADGVRITSEQIGAVNTRFEEYSTAIANYKTKVEQAIDIISERKVSAGIDGIVVSGRNMLPNTSNVLKDVSFSGWDYYFPDNLIGWEKNKPIIGKVWLEPQSYDASCMIHFRYFDSSYLQVRGSVIPAGTAGYSIVSTTIPDRDDISYIQFSIRHSVGTNPANIVNHKEAKVEMGTKSTGWSQAPEDIAYEIEQKADTVAVSDSINSISSSVSGAQATANAKLDKSAYDNFIKEYGEYKNALAADQSVAAGNLQAAQTAVASIQNEMGNMKESWIFNNGTKIEATGNGMLISDGNPAGMNMLLSQNRLSFFDGGVEVAYIADKTMKINHGIFVKSAQIGSHLISTSPTNSDITIVSFVGEG